MCGPSSPTLLVPLPGPTMHLSAIGARAGGDHKRRRGERISLSLIALAQAHSLIRHLVGRTTSVLITSVWFVTSLASLFHLNGCFIYLLVGY